VAGEQDHVCIRLGEKMSQDEIAQKIQEIIAQNLDVDKAAVVPSASFINDLNADSLDIVELVMGIEKEFDLEIPDDEAEKIRTVQDAVDYIVANAS
jgi:acyl carrier protein